MDSHKEQKWNPAGCLSVGLSSSTQPFSVFTLDACRYTLMGMGFWGPKIIIISGLQRCALYLNPCQLDKKRMKLQLTGAPLEDNHR